MTRKFFAPSHLMQKPSDQIQRARQGLRLFFALLIPFTALLVGVTIVTRNTAWIPLIMWIPGLASIITRLVRREGFADVSFRFGGKRSFLAILFALLYPTVIGVISYGMAWSTGLAHYVTPTGGHAGALLRLLSLAYLPPFFTFLLRLLLTTTLGTLVGMLLSAGEEIGWRGYMLTRLIKAHIPFPSLTQGFIWAMWHLPIILSGLYATGPSAPSPLISAMIFFSWIPAFAVLLAYLRLTTGSIWPPIVLHAAWNAIIQTVFDQATTGPMALLWTGESGILLMLTVIGSVLLLLWGSRRYGTQKGNQASLLYAIYEQSR